MYRILKAEMLADKIYLMDVEAPRIAKACQPGEFVIVKMDDRGSVFRSRSVIITVTKGQLPLYFRQWVPARKRWLI